MIALQAITLSLMLVFLVILCAVEYKEMIRESRIKDEEVEE